MRARVLIVDNEPEMLQLMRMLIREHTAYEPVTTNNPLEALEVVRQGGISLVITGLKMQGLDGIGLLTAIKGMDRDMPVIVMTAHGALESAMEVMKKGGFDFIVKPFRKERMLFAIRNALIWSKLTRENKELRDHLKEGKDLLRPASRDYALSGAP